MFRSLSVAVSLVAALPLLLTDAVGKSAAMSANPELKAKPGVLSALVKIVRDFKH